RADRERRGRDAVDVVVAVNRDRGAGAQVAEDEIDRLSDAAETRGVVGLGRVEKAASGGWIAESAARQDRGCGRSQAELADEGMGFGEGVRRHIPRLRAVACLRLG